MLRPANGGTEKPYRTRTGHLVCYMFDWKIMQHCFLNMETDIIIPPEDYVACGIVW